MEPKKKLSLSNVLPICCLVVILVTGASPFVAVFLQMQKGAHDMRLAKEEFKRTVNPNELRAWVSSQVRKHSLEWYSEKAKAEWPATFPHFAESRSFRVSLNQTYTTLVWDFSGGYGLKVTVWLDPDSAPFEADDSHGQWTKGITFDFLAK